MSFFDNLVQAAGELVETVVETAEDVVETVVDTVNDVANGSVADAPGNALAGAARVGGALFEGAQDAGQALGQFANSVGQAAGETAAEVAEDIGTPALKLARDVIDFAGEAATGIGEQLAPVGKAGEAIVGGFVQAGDDLINGETGKAIVEGVGQIGAAIGAGAAEVKEAAGEALEDIGNGRVGDLVGNAIEGAGKVGAAIGTGAEEVVGAVVNTGRSVGEAAVDDAKQAFDDVTTPVIEVGRQIGAGIGETLEKGGEIADGIRQAGNDLLNGETGKAILEGAGRISNAVGEGVEDVKETAGQALDAIQNGRVGDLIGNAIDGAGKVAGAIGEGTGAAGGALVDAVKDVGEAAANDAAKAFDDVATPIGEAGREIGTAIGEVLDGARPFVETIVDDAGAVADGVGKAFSDVFATTVAVNGPVDAASAQSSEQALTGSGNGSIGSVVDAAAGFADQVKQQTSEAVDAALKNLQPADEDAKPESLVLSDAEKAGEKLQAAFDATHPSGPSRPVSVVEDIAELSKPLKGGDGDLGGLFGDDKLADAFKLAEAPEVHLALKGDLSQPATLGFDLGPSHPDLGPEVGPDPLPPGFDAGIALDVHALDLGSLHTVEHHALESLHH